ncbi:MGH1-like glycoside hydrolase domain-containing protein [Desulforhabdus amnigena]|uniref:Glucosidase n=1 Tax=Desulforhabdus amnigena TaxID=40218 RepID=A0A9W6FRQ0_9BACT|nr:glucosidase [Desulforhabdus amnigena]NLJ26850.1 glucosidase [Deltaproteobacteria bacterium]GLI33767.1 glucosidase [Desulforhabdus amnigena]
MTAEHKRLEEARDEKISWKKWGPYLSERQWGTVREDYSDNGDAWNYFSHDQARSRAYRWGEDGLGGICDDHQVLCFALALWNGRDPILKERMFGLTNSEGNHGEDVKEYYFYLDSTPTHSYMKFLYKYPQQAFPYSNLVETNRGRSRHEMEYELLDTGVFDGDRYFDVFVEYAKAAPEDVLIKITVCNRGPDAAPIHVLPTLWFRNTWSWSDGGSKPVLRRIEGAKHSVIHAHHTDPLFQESLQDYTLSCEGEPTLLFTENETNNERLFGTPNAGPYVKDGINDYVLHGNLQGVNPEQTGTKASAHYALSIGAGETAVIRLRFSDASMNLKGSPFGKSFDEVFAARLREADEFYRSVTPPSVGEDEANVMRQALAGMLWTKQYYYFDADKWLEDHHAHPLHGHARQLRNREWFHMVNDHVISMPDKWEYPWYAAWDLAFHTIALSVVDPDFAKDQLNLMLQEVYLHPSGQIPAYEWNFSDVNPPVHAWATLFLHSTEQALHGKADIDFLKRAFAKLMLNFTWWVNRKDRFGKNVFEGGFLGLDNIGVFDRSAPLPTGGYLEQADGTAWMALFCQNMIELSVELAAHDLSYQDLCSKFVEHFAWIASGINRMGQDGMWDEEDGFYYDILRLPDGSAQRLKVRSMVGLLPLCATTVIEEWQRKQVPRVTESWLKRVKRMPELLESLHATGPGHWGVANRGILALVNQERLRRILTRMLDENEFLSPFGIRALSRYHMDHPYVFSVHGEEYRVQYLPAESDSGMFGGNSNWRGPIWMPVNALIIRALLSYYLYYGDNFKIECPTGSGKMMNLFEVSKEIASRLTRIFLRDEKGRRPVYGGTEKFQSDPLWRDHILFYEYFHGDNGAGLGASHQTGWTGLVARMIELFGRLDPQKVLEAGKRGAFVGIQRP